MASPLQPEPCGCLQCLRDRDAHVVIGKMKLPLESVRMVECPDCGSNCCPHADDHQNACAGRTEPGPHSA